MNPCHTASHFLDGRGPIRAAKTLGKHLDDPTIALAFLAAPSLELMLILYGKGFVD
jgi:hypothetical protein